MDSMKLPALGDEVMLGARGKKLLMMRGCSGCDADRESSRLMQACAPERRPCMCEESLA